MSCISSRFDDATGSGVAKGCCCVGFPSVGGGPSVGVLNLSVTGRGEIIPVGRLFGGLGRVVIFPSKLRAALDAALAALVEIVE